MSLADILAAKKKLLPLSISEAPPLIAPTFYPTLDNEEAYKNLRLFLLLCFRIEKKEIKSLMMNDWLLVKNLYSICQPFPSFSKEIPKIESVPAFHQSFYLWNISKIINIPGGILWKEILSVWIEAENFSLTAGKSSAIIPFQ